MYASRADLLIPAEIGTARDRAARAAPQDLAQPRPSTSAGLLSVRTPSS